MNSTVRWTLLAVVPAAVATQAKTQAEGLLQPWAEKMLPPAAAQRVEIGADPAGHPENMPPAEVADRATRAVTGHELGDDARQRVTTPLHWAMGMASGLLYALLGARWPGVRVGAGVSAGLALFGATHLTSLPAAKVQHPPQQLPRAWWIWEGGSHVVYGMALELGRRLLGRLLPA